MSPHPQNMPETEIDFINLARTLWEGRKLLGKIMLISIVAGLIVAAIIPNKYTASCTFVTQTADSESSLAKLSSLTGLAGIATLAGANIHLKIPSNMELSPHAYKDIIESETFQKELRTASISIEESGKTVKNLEKNINLVYDDFKGLATLSCTATEPRAAAKLCQFALQLLQDQITKISTEKARTKVNFIQERLDETKKHLENIQKELAAQKNQQNSAAAASKSVLEAEYDLYNDTKAELTKKLELAKIRLNEETPIFQIIKPVEVPTEKISPSRIKILSYFAFASFVLAMIFILGKEFFEETKEKWRLWTPS